MVFVLYSELCLTAHWAIPQVLKSLQLTADTLKWTWRQKFIYVLTLLPKVAQTKLLKFCCLKIFSICHWCRWHRWCTLSREYLREFSKKIEMAVIVYSDAWGKLIHEKNQKSKISWHCPFNTSPLFHSSSPHVLIVSNSFHPCILSYLYIIFVFRTILTFCVLFLSTVLYSCSFSSYSLPIFNWLLPFLVWFSPLCYLPAHPSSF